MVRRVREKNKGDRSCKAGMGPGGWHGVGSGAILYIVCRKELVKAASK